MYRYGLYTRKSHDDPKRTEKSIGDQLYECELVVARESLSVELKWQESKSAKIPGRRPLFREMIRAIEQGKIQAILCWHVNRLVRNMTEGGALVQLMIDGKLKEVRTPFAVYKSGENILPMVIEAASATQYSLDLVRDVKRSLESNFRAGGWNHKAPPGYRNDRHVLNSKRGIIVKDGKRFALIRKFWILMLSDSYTITEAIATLNDSWGYRSRPTAKRPSLPITKSTAFALLSNPFYAGFVQDKGELVKGRHEGMISVDDFKRVQGILERRGFRRKKRHEHTFTGLMQCKYCGQQITAETKRLRSGNMWEIYRCSDSWRRCTKRGIGASGVESHILDILEGLELDADLVTVALQDIIASIDLMARQTDLLRLQHEEAMIQAKSRLDRIDEMWISGLLTDELRYQELQGRERKAIAELTLAAQTTGSESERMRLNATRAANFVVNSRESFAQCGPRVKREIAAALATSYIFRGTEKRIEISVRPILREMVRFVRQKFGMFEPTRNSSQSQNKTALLEPVCFGGTESALLESMTNDERPEGSLELEVYETLTMELKGELFPELALLSTLPSDPSLENPRSADIVYPYEQGNP